MKEYPLVLKHAKCMNLVSGYKAEGKMVLVLLKKEQRSNQSRGKS